MSLLVAYALGLGVAYCAAPGATNAETIRRGLASGFGAAPRVQLGSIIGDATWAAIALLGAATIQPADSKKRRRRHCPRRASSGCDRIA